MSEPEMPPFDESALLIACDAVEEAGMPDQAEQLRELVRYDVTIRRIFGVHYLSVMKRYRSMTAEPPGRASGPSDVLRDAFERPKGNANVYVGSPAVANLLPPDWFQMTQEEFFRTTAGRDRFEFRVAHDGTIEFTDDAGRRCRVTPTEAIPESPGSPGHASGP